MVVDRRDRARGRPADAGRGVGGRGRRLHRRARRRARRARPAAGGAQRPRRPRAGAHRGRARSRWSRRGSTTGAPTRRPASGAGSPRRSCRRGAASPRRSPRCCRCCTCTACPRATSCPALEQFLGIGGGPVRAGDHPADRAVAGRGTRLRRPGSVQRGLRVPVGRRHPPQRPPGGGETVPAGDGRGARRRHQGARRPGRRLPGVDRVVGRPAARLRPPRHARPGAGGRATARSGSGPRCARCSPSTREQRCWFHKIANVLAALPKSAHPGREEGAGRDLERRGPRPRPSTP